MLHDTAIRFAFIMGMILFPHAGHASRQDVEEVRPANEAVRQLLEAMEIAGIRSSLESPEGPVASSWQAESWEDGEGDSSAEILAMFDRDDVLLVFPRAFDLSLCAHIDACRRLIAESYWRVGGRVKIGFDPRDGEVRASVRLIGAKGRVESTLLRQAIEDLIRGVDEISWPMWKAMDTGNVDWVADDVGPSIEAAELVWTREADGAEIRVASWVEKEIFASTVFAFDEFGRRIVSMNDGEAERFGGELLAPYRDGVLAPVLHRDWAAFWNWIKWHYPPISVRVWAPPGTVVRGVVRNDDLFARPCEASVVVDRTGESEIDFLPDWNRTALLGLDASRRVAFDFEFAADGEVMRSGTRSLRSQSQLQPVGVVQNDLPLCLPVAIHVDETHPWIDGLVAEAARSGIAGSLGDNPTLSRRDQLLQILAVWKVFRDRGVVYTNIAKADASRNGQRIRTLHESIGSAQANCLDGSVALASVLAALSYEVYQVRLPGHAMLAVLLNPLADGEEDVGIPPLIGIETTQLGREYEPDATPEEWQREFERAVRIPAHASSDWENFAWATGMGTFTLWNAIGDASARLVPLELLRDCGLVPVPSLRARVGTLPEPPDIDEVRRRRAAADAELDRNERTEP
ncbi:MAG: hypothetical protein RI967_1374 [Planctomycetota bacterium]|jgi:hypothetical protein